MPVSCNLESCQPPSLPSPIHEKDVPAKIATGIYVPVRSLMAPETGGPSTDPHARTVMNIPSRVPTSSTLLSSTTGAKINELKLPHANLSTKGITEVSMCVCEGGVGWGRDV